MTVEAQLKIQVATREFLAGRSPLEAYNTIDVPSLPSALVRQWEHINKARILEKLDGLRSRLKALLDNPSDPTSIESV
jgi:hypothetical protein